MDLDSSPGNQSYREAGIQIQGWPGPKLELYMDLLLKWIYEFIVFGRPGCKHIICQGGVHVHDIANLSHEHMFVRSAQLQS